MSNGNGHHAVEVGFANGRAPAALIAAPIFESRSVPVQLVVDDDEHIREVCRSMAEESGMRVLDVPSAEEALEMLEISSVDILLTDRRLPGSSGLELLSRVTQTHPDIAVVMLTQYGTIDSAVEATRMGAADYVTKPFRVEELRARLEQVVHAVELKRCRHEPRFRCSA